MGFSHLWADKTPVAKHQPVSLRCQQGGPLSWAHFVRLWLWVPLAASLHPWPCLAGSWNTLSSPMGSKRERLDLILRLLWRFPGSCHGQNLQIFQSASLLGSNPPKTVVATHCSATDQPCLCSTDFSKQGSPSHPGQGGLSTSLKMVRCGSSGRPGLASRCFLGLPG